jgi:hypothetical protein
LALSREGKQDMSETHSTIRGGQRLLWYTERLWRLAEKLPPFEISICGVPELDQNCWFDGSEPTLRRVAEHCARINDADLLKPIILNADGSLMDGGHRLCKALLEGRQTILAVRFDVMPTPDEISDAGPIGRSMIEPIANK